MGQGLAALLEFDMEIGLLCTAAFILSVFVPSFLYQLLFFALVVWFSFLIMLASENQRYLYI